MAVGCLGEGLQGLEIAGGEAARALRGGDEGLGALGDVAIRADGWTRWGVVRRELLPGVPELGDAAVVGAGAFLPHRARDPGMEVGGDWLRRCKAGTIDAEFGQQMLIKQVKNVAEFREHSVGVSG
ncbi:hypothetical protein ADK90_19515 [Streptomyces sp. XY413]|uniref:hypothetical protein n=1 Tax=Streptomyces sp. XY413 TaxID=1519479 RepID=UPI0006AD99C1|nr:hypothetical protein [Streptomyces sp. XY413]KOV18904.1 hypothetical protein ADK90_19515 [Streptomyces sp. XY413]